MKKGWLRKTVAVTLGLALTAGGLTACGRGNPMENADLAKEYVYRYEELNLPDLGGDDINVRGSQAIGDRAYVMLQVYHWSEGDDTDYRVLSMNKDGSDLQVVPLEMPGKKGADVFGDELGAAAGTDAEDVGAEDTDVPADDTDDAEEDVDDTDVGEDADIDGDFSVDADMPVDEDYSNIWESTSFGTVMFGQDRIFATENYWYEDYSDPDNTISLRKNYVCSWGMDGSLLWETELEDLQTDEEYIYVSSFVSHGDGSAIMLMSGDNCYSQDVTADGVPGARTKLPDEIGEILSRSQYLLPKKDGTFTVVYADTEDWMKQYISNYDPETQQLGESVQMPTSFSMYGYNISTGLNADLLYSDSNGVYEYNAGDESGTKKMDFINSDLGINYFQQVVELDEDTFLGIFYDEDYMTVAGLFTHVDPKDIPDKKVLVLAGNSISTELRRRVVAFNRNSDEYRITLKTYDEYRTPEDWEAGYTRLNNDIITGNMPDILVTQGLPVENYIAKGLLADIGKMIEADAELSEVEFMQNVFDAYSVDGKLYYVIPSFNVRTVVAKSRIVGDRDTWTMADMLQLQQTLPDDAEMFGSTIVRYDFYNMVMQYCGADFIDVDTGKCNFDSPGFIAMMEYGMDLPQELPEDFWEYYDWESMESAYREDRSILYSLYISNLSNLNYVINGYIGEDVSFIGFPTESGQGSVIGLDSAYCISSRSANKDGAWEFLRYYLTDEYQDTLTYGLPIQKDNFETKAQEATQRPYYIDSETGEKVEYDDTYYMNGEDITLSPMTQEQVDQCVEFIYSVNKPIYSNDSILTIISEEIESYYSGQKSAEEVAKVIQSRAQVYVDENR